MNFSHLSHWPPRTDWMILGLFFAAIFAIIFVGELIRKRLDWRQEVTRKIVHISVGVLIVFAPLFLDSVWPLLSIAFFFAVFNFFAIRKNSFPGMHIDPGNLGTFYYPLSFFVLLFFFWNGYKMVIVAAMLVMSVGDALAAIVGQNIRSRHSYILISDQKSLEGSLAMFLSSFLMVAAALLFYPRGNITAIFGLESILWIAVIIAIIATAAESLGNRGNDNLSVPLLSGFVLYYLLTVSFSGRLQFSVAIILAALTALISFRLHFLSNSGGMATFLLASIIFGFGGWAWTIPVLTFFVLSSMLSKAGKSKKKKYDLIFEKGSRRDYAQVVANGGIAGLLMILFMLLKFPEIYIFYLGALAAAAADTWATEIGILIGQKPRLISNLKPVESGTSGGVTYGGIIGATIGALLIGLSGLFFLPNGLALDPVKILILVTVSGVLASLMDSLLGATVQVQYYCKACHKITEKKEHCPEAATVISSGISWIDNDLVNFLCTVSGFLLVLAGLNIL